MSAEETENERLLRVFLCHSKLDKAAVRKLHRQLSDEGVHPWLDEVDLVAGEDWELAIGRAVRASDVILVLLSSRSVTTPGFAHKEIRLALDEADRKPEGTIFIIPVRLVNCVVPDRLSRWHWIDLFDEHGFDRLIRALGRRAAELGIKLRKKQRGPTFRLLTPEDFKKLSGHRPGNGAPEVEKMFPAEVPPDHTTGSEHREVGVCPFCGGKMYEMEGDSRSAKCRGCGHFNQWSD